jgi:hypothetical protein
MRPRGRKHASAQQKARCGNPARTSGAISMNTRVWKILVTRVNNFLLDFAGSVERPENSADLCQSPARKTCGSVGQRRINAYPGCRHRDMQALT